MGLNCCTVFAKIVLILTNIIYMLVSVGLIGFGTFFLIHHADIELVVGNESIGWFVGFVLVGVATFVISLVGVVGAAAGKHRILIAYIFATSVLAVVLMIGTGLSLSSTERNSKKVGNQFLKFINEYSPSNETDTHDLRDADGAVDIVQKELECCGLRGPSDWYDTQYGIPSSCSCTLDDKELCRELTALERTHLAESVQLEGIWKQGCNTTLEAIIEVHFFVMGSSCFFFAFLELGTVLVTLGLCVCILKGKKQRERIERIQSVAYTPLDSYPANTISNSQFVADFGDEELLKDGEINMNI